MKRVIIGGGMRLSNLTVGMRNLTWMAIGLVCVAATVLLVIGINRARVGTTDRSGTFPLPTQKSTSENNQIQGPGSPREGHPSYGISKICFVRDHYVFVLDPRTTETKRIIAGEKCALSPSGNDIAFTVYTNPPNKIGFPETIKIFNLPTETIGEPVPFIESHKTNPHWSLDGSKLAFEFGSHGQTHVGILNVSTGAWSDITRNLDFLEPWGEINRFGVNFDSWLPDSKSIVCQDLNFMYEIALDGSTLQKIPIATIADPHEVVISNSMGFSFSPDRKLLLFEGNSEVKTGNINLALYVFDCEKRELSRVSPENFDATNPVWLPSGRDIVFLRHEENEDHSDISDLAVISLDRREVSTILKGVSSASYSTK